MTDETAVNPRGTAVTTACAVVGICWAAVAVIVAIGVSMLSSRVPASVWILLPLEKNVPPTQNTFEYATHDVVLGGWIVSAVTMLVAVAGFVVRARWPALTAIAATLIALWVSESSFAVFVAVHHQRDFGEVASRAAVADYLTTHYFLGYALALGAGLLTAVYLPLHLRVRDRRKRMATAESFGCEKE